MALDSLPVLSILDRVTDADGAIVPGAVLYFYGSGTTDPLTVYADAALAVVDRIFTERGLVVAIPPLYARVDLARDGEDRPLLMELELFEPSYFLDLAPGAERLLVDAVVARLSA